METLGDTRATTLVLLLGTDPASMGAILDDTRRAFGGDRLVYLTDSPDFVPFRERGAIFEYLPSPRERAAFQASVNWRDYLAERWQLLLGKWSPRRVLVFGATMEAFIAATARGRAARPPADRPARLADADARLSRSRIADGETR